MGKFKPGDVVRYRREGEWRIGIVASPKNVVSSLLPREAVWANWKYEQQPWGTELGWVNPDVVELHPDADKIWADYCAAVLAGDM